MSERVTSERVRELLAVDGTRRMFGGVLMDAALVRDLAADLLDARAAVALARTYRDAVIAERAAETAHTNAGPGARQPAMAAMLAARGVRTTAEARLGAALAGTTTDGEVPCG